MADTLGAVTALWRYPVSSLAGEALDSIAVGRNGLDGDRRFGLVDVGTDEIARPDTGERWAKAPRIRARLNGSLEIAIPGGDFLFAPDARSDSAVSSYLGFDAAIRPYDRDIVPDYTGPLTGSRYLEAPIHLLTTASLARLKALHPAGNPDPRRFRPNILVDMPAVEGSFPETEWIGRRIAVGEIELTISEPCRRCGFTILEQDGIANDPEILRQLVRNNRRNIGVYCTVDRPGIVSAGDAMRLLD
jgi:uncharacterized protein YcbX